MGFRRGFCIFFLRMLSKFQLNSSMTKVCQLVVVLCRIPRDKEFLSIFSYKRQCFIKLEAMSSHRKNFNPTVRFVVCSEHFTDDCFARSYHVGGSMKRIVQGAILSVRKKNMKTIGSSRDHRMVSLYFLVIVAL